MKARKRFGQHFLRPEWVQKLLEAIQPRPTDTFLEIGAGQGELTIPLARRAARVVAVEIDRELTSRLAAAVPANVELVQGDFLKVDIASLLALPAGPARAASVAGGQPPDSLIRVVGNLPYKISSPVLFRLFALSRGPLLLADAVLMLQREVADRLVAKPGTRTYGVLTIFTALHAEAVRLWSLPPGAFRSPPKVTSSVVRLGFRRAPVHVSDRAGFEALVRALFTRRRKTVLNALKPLASGASLSAREVLDRAELDPRRRPETLQLAELARLAGVFASGGRGPMV